MSVEDHSVLLPFYKHSDDYLSYNLHYFLYATYLGSSNWIDWLKTGNKSRLNHHNFKSSIRKLRRLGLLERSVSGTYKINKVGKQTYEKYLCPIMST